MSTIIRDTKRTSARRVFLVFKVSISNILSLFIFQISSLPNKKKREKYFEPSQSRFQSSGAASAVDVSRKVRLKFMHTKKRIGLSSSAACASIESNTINHYRLFRSFFGQELELAKRLLIMEIASMLVIWCMSGPLLFSFPPRLAF